MSQIFATKNRGRVYQCLRCPSQDIKSRFTSHFYKEHLTLEQAPFYCQACSFRCTEMEPLLKHITPNSYPAHTVKMAKLLQTEPQLIDQDVLMKSNNPYILVEGRDYKIFNSEDSGLVWKGRAKSSGGSPLFPTATATTNSSYLSDISNTSTPNNMPVQTFNNMPSFTPNTIVSTTPTQNFSTAFHNMPLLASNNTLPTTPTSTPLPTQNPISLPILPLFANTTTSTPVLHIPSPPAVTRQPEEDVLHQLLQNYDPQEPISPIPRNYNSTTLNTPIHQNATPNYRQTPTPVVLQQPTPDAPSPSQQPTTSNPLLPSSDSLTLQTALHSMTADICKAINNQTVVIGLINGTLRTVLGKFEERERKLEEKERRMDEREARMIERETRERERNERARENLERQERMKEDHEKLERARRDYERIENERRDLPSGKENKRKHIESEVVKQKKKK